MKKKPQTQLQVLQEIRDLLQQSLEKSVQLSPVQLTKKVMFPYFDVDPINDVEQGIREGNLTSHYDFITNETVKLVPAQGRKRVYVVPFNETVGQNDYAARLAEYGLKPCQNAPNYLLGLLKQVPEHEMPQELANKHIVAAEPKTPSSVFQGRDGDQCFLYACRLGANRGLDLRDVSREWDGYWAFLAEIA